MSPSQAEGFRGSPQDSLGGRCVATKPGCVHLFLKMGFSLKFFYMRNDV